MEIDMTKGRPLPLILKFVIPLVIGNIFQQLYNMADTIIVGRFVGDKALAAVGSTGTVMFLVTGFAQGMTAGFSVLTAQRYGAGDSEGVKRSVGNGAILALMVTIILTFISVVMMDPLLRLMNTPEDIFQDAYTYISLICWGLCGTILYNLVSSYLRAVGNSKVPLYFLIMSAVLNVVLDLVLIINFHMGVAGAAVATVISQLVSGIVCVIYIYKAVPMLRPERRHYAFHKGDSKYQIAMGLPMALQFSITACGTMVMQSAINLFGSTAVAAFTAANKLQNLLTQGMVAMGQMSATYAGQNCGKGDYGRIREGVKASIKIDVIYSILASIFLTVALPYGIRLFFAGDITELMPYGRTYVNISVIFYIPLSFIFVFRNFMQGCGFGFLPMMGGVVELAARFVVAQIAIALHSFVLACACDPAAWVAACVFTGVSYCFVMKKLDRRKEAYLRTKQEQA